MCVKKKTSTTINQRRYEVPSTHGVPIHTFSVGVFLAANAARGAKRLVRLSIVVIPYNCERTTYDYPCHACVVYTSRRIGLRHEQHHTLA